MSVWMGEYMKKLKFYGVLSSYDCDTVNLELLHTLIEKKIVNVVRDYKQEDCVYNWMNEVKDSMKFSWYMYYDKKEYSVSNEVFEELYEIVKRFIIPEGLSYEIEIDELNFSLNRFIDKESKLSFLKAYYEREYPKDIEFGIFIEDKIFTENIELSDGRKYKRYRTWKELFFDELKESQLWIDYLTEDVNNLEKESEDIVDKLFDCEGENQALGEFIDKWIYFIERDCINNHILSKIQELEKKIVTTEDDSKPSLKDLKALFKESGVEKKYDNVINLLIEKERVKKVNDDLEIVIPNKYKKRGKQHFICSLGMQLYNKGYIPSIYDGKVITEALNNTFVNSSVTRKNYFALKESPRQDIYLQYFNFISVYIV